jgi:hypothetical protein
MDLPSFALICVLMFLIQCCGCELFAIVMQKLCLGMYPAGLSFGFRSSVANKKLLFSVYLCCRYKNLPQNFLLR